MIPFVQKYCSNRSNRSSRSNRLLNTLELLKPLERLEPFCLTRSSENLAIAVADRLIPFSDIENIGYAHVLAFE